MPRSLLTAPGIDEPLAMEKGGLLYYYHADGLGSIVKMTDGTGKAAQAYEYDSFGKLHDKMNAIKQPYAFTGRERDKDTGLYYYRARYYDAETGRFTTKDPVRGSIERPQTLNPYPYAGNNPVNWVDPWGLDSLLYNLRNSTLYWLDDNNRVIGSWPAVSGPWGKGPLPYGDYTLNKPPSLVPSNQISYCDPSGNCWWQPIIPDFSTNRTGLGIHPEGGVPGTKGCIGVQDSDTSSLYKQLREYLINRGLLPLRVE